MQAYCATLTNTFLYSANEFKCINVARMVSSEVELQFSVYCNEAEYCLVVSVGVCQCLSAQKLKTIDHKLMQLGQLRRRQAWVGEPLQNVV